LIDRRNLAALPSNEISTSKKERKEKDRRNEPKGEARRSEATRGEDEGTDPEEKNDPQTKTAKLTDDGCSWMNEYS
jgi:hypothetical protein